MNRSARVLTRPRFRFLTSAFLVPFAFCLLPLSAFCLLPLSAAQAWRAAAVSSFDDAWQVINDTFYDPTFGGLDWAAVKRELRPRAEAAATPEAARGVIREMLARLKRSHFALMTASPVDLLPGPAVVGAEIRMIPEGALVTRVAGEPAAGAGLAAGQTIVAIDDRDVADLVRLAAGPDAKTRQLDAWRRVNQILHGADGSTAVLRVRTADGKIRELTVPRTGAEGEVVTLGNLPPLHVAFESRELATPAGRRAGYVCFSVWMTAIGEPFERAVDQYRRHEGLIIDLRGNPGGLAAMIRGIAGHVLAEPVVLGTMRTRSVPEPLVFTANPRTVMSDGRQVAPFAGPVAILVDELTGSTSEVFAGALQSLGRARIFGRQTMGQALPALTRQLPNGDVLLHAIGDFVTSSGRSLEGGGVTPDVTVPLSARSLAAGRDDTIEAALAWFDRAGRRPEVASK